ncbi:hypothetical protein IEQ34_021401 [Dendrobium chrysotoxum]|uniref:Uncharacterized protein n=1 Tax=Dendrobium chrysotoxum TaxID=161865 RepID=A0AAV7G515_DENCH|nr:hypothetical protein IEQ34_021401 [Dendrobium chrysotoxum]
MVDKRIGTELFYYFIESENEPGKDPLLLWLSGGPGCSSFYGLYEEIGPMRFNRIRYNGTLPTLNYHPYTWTKVNLISGAQIFNIIFLDWPPGTGFSFSEHFEYQILDDYQSINQIHIFLKQWFVDHPNFLLNPFYVGGDSYGGKMATLVSYKIAQGIEAFDQPLINFKGYLIGNPRTGIDEIDINPRVAHAYELGIISHELKELIERHCVGEDYMLPKTALCTAHLKVLQKFLDEIVIDNILSPKCIEDNSTFEQNESNLGSLYEEDDEEPSISKSDLNCPDYTSYLASHWFDYYPIREALGVKKGGGHEAPRDKPRECWTILKRWISYEPL